MNFEVEEWLQKIVAVKHESGISRLLQQLRWSAEIESFLRRLETNLRALVSSHHINTAYNCQLIIPQQETLMGFFFPQVQSICSEHTLKVRSC